MRRRSFLTALGLLCSALPLHAQAAVPRTLRIYLARHGESAANVAGTLAGSADVPLTEKGRQQAVELSEILRDVPLDAIYSSTMSRTRVTAQIASGGKQVHPLSDLTERNFGRFEGKSTQDPEYLRRLPDDADSLDGGESRVQVLERVRRALTQIQREHPAGSILIVGHSVTNRMVLRTLLSLTSEQTNAINQDNDEVYSIELTDGQQPRLWKLIRQKNLADL